MASIKPRAASHGRTRKGSTAGSRRSAAQRGSRQGGQACTQGQKNACVRVCIQCRVKPGTASGRRCASIGLRRTASLQVRPGFRQSVKRILLVYVAVANAITTPWAHARHLGHPTARMPPRPSITGVSKDNIIEGGRKRARHENDSSAHNSPLLSSSMSLARSSSHPISDATNREKATKQGFRLLDFVINRVDPSDRSPLCIPFLALPSRAEIPDYYEQIKTPLSLEQIRRRLQARQYGTLEEVRNALETVWRNAKRYNLKGSEIYEQARTLHSATRESYVDLVEKDRLAPVQDGAPQESTPSLEEQSAKLAKVERPNALARLDFDDHGKGPSKVSLRLKKSDDIPYEEDKEPTVSQDTARDGAGREGEERRSEQQGQEELGVEKKPEQEPVDTEMADTSREDTEVAKAGTPNDQRAPSTPAQNERPGESDGENEDVVDLKDMPGYDPVTGLLNGNAVDSSMLTLGGKFDRRKRPGPRGKRLKSTLRHLVTELKGMLKDNGELLCSEFMQLPSKERFPDYYNVIAKPISLGMIDEKAMRNGYESSYALVSDLRVLVANAKYYNDEKSEIWKSADIIGKHLEDVMVPSLLADGFTMDPSDLRQSALPTEYAAVSTIPAHAAAFKRAQGGEGGQSASPEPSSVSGHLQMRYGGYDLASASPVPYAGVRSTHGTPYSTAQYPGNGAAMSPMAQMPAGTYPPGSSPQQSFAHMSGQTPPGSLPWQPQGRSMPHMGSQPGYPFPSPHMQPSGYPGPATTSSPGQGRPMYPPHGGLSFQHHGSGTPGMPDNRPFTGQYLSAHGQPAARTAKRLLGEAPPDPYETASILLGNGTRWRRKPVSPSFIVSTKTNSGREKEVILPNDLTRIHALNLGAHGTTYKGDKEVLIGFRLREVVRAKQNDDPQGNKDDVSSDETGRVPWKVVVRYNGQPLPLRTEPVGKSGRPNEIRSAVEAKAREDGLTEVAQGSFCSFAIQPSLGSSVLDVTVLPSPPDAVLTAIANDAQNPHSARARALLQLPDKYRIFLHCE